MQWFFNKFWHIKWDLWESQLSVQHDKAALVLIPHKEKKYCILTVIILLLLLLGQRCFWRNDGIIVWNKTANNLTELIACWHLQRWWIWEVAGKFNKNRLTRLAAGNALSQKLPMFVIVKANKQKCFKNWNLSRRYRDQNKVEWTVICVRLG